MKKETLIIVFYVLYFLWLFLITYLTKYADILNYYTIGVIAFYFLFLREKGDFGWFTLGIIASVLITITHIGGFQIKFDTPAIALIPLWLPLAWGTTLVALRKFFVLLDR